MTLRPDQRAELETLGAPTVRLKLIQPGVGGGRGACVSGFTSGDMDRGDIEDWLAEKYAGQVRVERWVLWAAIIAAVTGVLTVWHDYFK
jgi:hypothetical protein